MKFQVFDLLAFTALVAMYISGCSYALGRLRPGEFQRESLGLAGTFIFFFVVTELSIRYRRNKNPEGLRLPSHIAWRNLFITGVSLFAIALGANFVIDGAFFVLSVPFVTLVLMVLLRHNVYASASGVLVHFIPWPWKNIEIVSVPDDTLQLRFKPTWLRLTADVPHEDKQRVLDFASAATSEEYL